MQKKEGKIATFVFRAVTQIALLATLPREGLLVIPVAMVVIRHATAVAIRAVIPAVVQFAIQVVTVAAIAHRAVLVFVLLATAILAATAAVDKPTATRAATRTATAVVIAAAIIPVMRAATIAVPAIHFRAELAAIQIATQGAQFAPLHRLHLPLSHLLRDHPFVQVQALCLRQPFLLQYRQLSLRQAAIHQSHQHFRRQPSLPSRSQIRQR